MVTEKQARNGEECRPEDIVRKRRQAKLSFLYATLRIVLFYELCFGKAILTPDKATARPAARPPTFIIFTTSFPFDNNNNYYPPPPKTKKKKKKKKKKRINGKEHLIKSEEQPASNRRSQHLHCKLQKP